MLKLLGYILILIGSTAIGFKYAERFRQRVNELNELERSIFQLKNEIIYTYTPIPEAFFSIAQKSKKPVALLFKNAAEKLCANEVVNVYEALKSSIEENFENINLNKKDMSVILDLSKMLGQSDIEGQKGIFILTIENIKKQIKEADDAVRGNVKMYRYLGFFVGASMVIMLL